MNCTTAKLVWNHNGGFLQGLQTHLPNVLPELERMVTAFVNGTVHSFNQAVQKVAPGNYYCEHAITDTDELAAQVHDVVGDVTARTFLQNFFSKKFGQPIVLGNICCSSCVISGGPIDDDLMYRIQMTAVNLDPENLPA